MHSKMKLITTSLLLLLQTIQALNLDQSKSIHEMCNRRERKYETLARDNPKRAKVEILP
jgi:predicted transcriptional regulator